MSDHGLIGVEQRLKQLCGSDRLLGYAITDTTDDGVYVPTVRVWDHPEVDGAQVLAFRYAYLTNGEGGDAWVDWFDAAGINMRVPPYTTPEEFLQALAQLFAACIPRLDGDSDPASADLTPAAEE